MNRRVGNRAGRSRGGLALRIARLWEGAVPLARAFWEYAILYGLMANLAATLAAAALTAAGVHPALTLAVFLLPVPYNILVLVAVWRSAGRYAGPPHWAALARAAIVVWVLVATLA